MTYKQGVKKLSPSTSRLRSGLNGNALKQNRISGKLGRYSERNQMRQIAMLIPTLVSFCFPAPGQVSETRFSIDDISWISGSWQGMKGESFIEEVWSAPEGSNMTGMFRMVRNGRPRLFEFMSIQETNQVVTLAIKHFDSDMTGWEEKDRSELFTLVELEGTIALFDHDEEGKSLTYDLVGDELSITLRELRDGEPTTVRFDFRRIQ